VKRRRLAVGDGRPVAAGEDGGQVAPAPGQLVRWDEAVDAAVDAVEATGRRAFVDGLDAQALRDKVPERENQVLASGQFRYLGV
jgi:hypothetical protein